MHEHDAIIKSDSGSAYRSFDIGKRHYHVVSNGVTRKTMFEGQVRESFPEEFIGHLDWNPNMVIRTGRLSCQDVTA